MPCVPTKTRAREVSLSARPGGMISGSERGFSGPLSVIVFQVRAPIRLCGEMSFLEPVQETVLAAGSGLIFLNRKSVLQKGPFVVEGLRYAIIFFWRFG